ncbi:glycosyltransferase family 4 protein [Chryseobacterium lineare]
MDNLWIATELFYPEQTSTSFILTKIANRLSEKYSVKVVCGQPVYDKDPKNTNYFTLNSDISVHKIKGLSKDKNSLFFRTLRFVFLSFSMFFYLLKNVKKGEKVFIVTNPAPLVLLISVLKIIKDIQLIILVHDVFPENTVPAGILQPKSLTYKFIKRIFDKAYSKADKLIVLGRDMEKIVQDKIRKYTDTSKIHIVENWGDINEIYPIPKEKIFDNTSPLYNKIIFQYAGNIGRVQGLLELLEIVKEVDNDKLVFYFVGEGAVKKSMMEYVKANHMKNVYFDGEYSREDQLSVLNKADIAFVSLSKGMFGLGVPSKAYNILASGKPILYIGEENSEIDLLITEKNVGYSFRSDQKDVLISFFNSFDEKGVEDLELKKKNARKTAEESFSEEIILNKFYYIIQ